MVNARFVCPDPRSVKRVNHRSAILGDGHESDAADSVTRRSGGARRDRTADLLHAMQALSQLSYGPMETTPHVL
jgi:hypothetical protein